MDVFAFSAGIFTIAAAVLNWDWFFNDSRAAFFVRVLGRGGARAFYLLLGGSLLLIAYILSCPTPPLK